MSQFEAASSLYQQSSLTLLTDFYQLTMAYGYWKKKIHQKQSIFHLSFRRAPFQGGFTLAAGLQQVIEYLLKFRFAKDDLDYLAQLRDSKGCPYFEEPFLNYLLSLRFSGDLDAVPEGTAVYPQEPLLRIQAPLVECQLLESPLLNLINFPSLIATKSARICIAAQGESVLEFGLRRAQGIDGAVTASRAAYIGGCDSTSNVLAGKLFGIPVRGTHAHSWVMVFNEEEEAFEAYADAFPEHALFLVDTYNTIEGVRHAIRVGEKLRNQGHTLKGIRLDSGDLADLSIKARALLDEAGFHEAMILASNDLDETVIQALKQQGAKITVWGVGTNLVTAKDQPALDGVYKISALQNDEGEWEYKLKLSEQMVKISNPGILQVRRFFHKQTPIADAIFDIRHPWEGDCTTVDPLDSTRTMHIDAQTPYQDLLVPIFRSGRAVYTSPPLQEIRANAQNTLEHLPKGTKRFVNPHLYPVGLEKKLYQIKIALVQELRTRYKRQPE